MRKHLAAAVWLAAQIATLAAAKSDDSIAIRSFVSEVSSLTAAQHNLPADEVRSLDQRLNGLSAQAAALGPEAAPAFFSVADDPAQPIKLRLWMTLYLDSLRDATAFPPLEKLLLNPAHPDLIREAAARGAAACPVDDAAKRRALCSALDARPGRATLSQTLWELRALGCEDPAPLERAARSFGKRPAPTEAARVAHAADALAASRGRASIERLDVLFDFFARGSPARGAVLEALAKRAPELKAAGRPWLDRAVEMLLAEARAPANAESGLRFLAALEDARAVPTMQKFLRHEDGAVVVTAAEALASLDARQAHPALRRLQEGFPMDPRFAPAPNKDAIGLYERLGAALKRLER